MKIIYHIDIYEIKIYSFGECVFRKQKSTRRCLDLSADGMLKRLIERWVHVAQIEWRDLVNVVVQPVGEQ